MTQMFRRFVILTASPLLAAMLVLTGCKSTPPPPTGFISDYSKLKKVETGWMKHVSPKLNQYSTYMVDPVQVRVNRDVLDAQKRAEVARYMRDALNKVLKEGGFKLSADPGVGIARLRVAITDVQESKWYLNIHPATKLTGAGRAGASMEAEVIDSVTGEQLAAAIRAGKGKQFELLPYTTLDDIKNVIDKWAESAGKTLKELREGKGK